MLRVLTLLALVGAASAFAPSSFPRSRAVGRSVRAAPLEAVKDVGSEADFDATISAAGDSLVIIDFSTTWCGPCKVMEPKFIAMSDEFPGAVFVKVIGDSSPDASKLMKREGVRSVPAFHFWKGGEKVDMVNGANVDALTGAISKYV